MILMIIDHALLGLAGDEAWAQSVRLTATRAALPIFGILAGHLAATRPPKFDRVVLLALAAGLASQVGPYAHIPGPDVLWLLAGSVLAVGFTPSRYRVALLAVAVIQPTTWHMAWAGYQPGVVLGVVLAGSWATRDSLDGLGSRLPDWLGWAGRRPLLTYVGHMAVLAVAVQLVGGGRVPG